MTIAPSLSIRDADDNKVLVRCHAQCDQERVIFALRSRGVWVENSPRSASLITRRATIERKPDHDDTKRTKAALAIWQSAKPSHGTPVAIHRTFLARDGAGKAPVDPPKMMFGPCRGAAVRLADPSGVLMAGEGIETCLAAMLATGYPAWAALSTSGLRSLDLPKNVRDLIALADGDEAGDAAAEDSALRCKRQGRRVRIARPPRGMDFNEMLTGRAPFVEERPQ
jgi:putative DNA primase/helicase